MACVVVLLFDLYALAGGVASPRLPTKEVPAIYMLWRADDVIQMLGTTLLLTVMLVPAANKRLLGKVASGLRTWTGLVE